MTVQICPSHLQVAVRFGNFPAFLNFFPPPNYIVKLQTQLKTFPCPTIESFIDLFFIGFILRMISVCHRFAPYLSLGLDHSILLSSSALMPVDSGKSWEKLEPGNQKCVLENTCWRKCSGWISHSLYPAGFPRTPLS